MNDTILGNQGRTIASLCVKVQCKIVRGWWWKEVKLWSETDPERSAILARLIECSRYRLHIEQFSSLELFGYDVILEDGRYNLLYETTLLFPSWLLVFATIVVAVISILLGSFEHGMERMLTLCMLVFMIVVVVVW